VASSRNPSKTPEKVNEVEHLGGKWVYMDVASPQLEDQVKAALAVYGRIDVLVNNAGIGMGGAVEDFRSGSLSRPRHHIL
jgi:NAD(P)-dependent dehydrogenase (short-subunit alcohol dehydrogenase family)